jgi:hypothetical protein
LTRRYAEATTPGVGDATIARRIGAPRPNHQVRKPSAGPYDRRRSEALAKSEALIADLECLSKEVPNAKRHASNFEPAEAVKSVPLDPSNDACKQVRIGSELDPK